MRILRISPDVYPYSWGGIAVHSYLLSKVQAEMGHRVTVLTVDDGNDAVRMRNPFEVVRLPGFRDRLGNPFVLTLPQYLSSHLDEFDLIHLHSHLFTLSIIAAWSAPKTGPPVVLTCHGVRSAAVPFVLSDAYLRTIVKATLHRVRRVLCYTESDARQLAGITKTRPEKYVVVQNGVPLDVFTPMVSPANREPVVLWAGRMVHLKGLETLIRAMAIVIGRLPEARLQLIGDGPERSNVLKLAEQLGITPQVTRKAVVPFEKMPQLYNESKVCVVASKTEGMPRTLMESLACGVPVVSSRLPQLGQFDGNGVVLFDPESETELAQTLLAVLNGQDGYVDMCERARKLATERFDWKSTVYSISRVFEDTLEKSAVR